MRKIGVKGYKKIMCVIYFREFKKYFEVRKFKEFDFLFYVDGNGLLIFVWLFLM